MITRIQRSLPPQPSRWYRNHSLVFLQLHLPACINEVGPHMHCCNEVALVHHDDASFVDICTRTQIISHRPTAFQIIAISNSIHLPFYMHPGAKRKDRLVRVELPLHLCPRCISQCHWPQLSGKISRHEQPFHLHLDILHRCFSSAVALWTLALGVRSVCSP